MQENNSNDLTIRDLISVSEVSVRLVNCINSCNPLPIETVSEYLTLGDSAVALFRKLPNVGRKTAYELDSIIRSYIAAGDQALPVLAKGPDPRYIALYLILEAIPFLDTIFLYEISVRLKNCLRDFNADDAESWQSEITTFKDFIIGENVQKHFLRMINFGRKSLIELNQLVDTIITNTVVALTGAECVLTAESIRAKTVEGDLLNQISNYAANQSAENIRDSVVKILNHANVSENIIEEPELLGIISQLPQKEYDVIIRRYGLEGKSVQTLEEISTEFYVTRERVRQVEKKALNRLRNHKYFVLFSAHLKQQAAHIIKTLSNSAEVILPDTLNTNLKMLPSLVLLGIDVVHESIEGWLNDNCTIALGGWISKEFTRTEEISSAAEKLLQFCNARALPLPVELIAQETGLSVFSIRQTDEISSDIRIFEDYVFKGYSGPRLKRAIRLHKLLCHEKNSLKDFRYFLSSYRTAYPDDVCQMRVAEIVMEDYPHLFLKLFENFWLPLPMDINAFNQHGNEGVIETFIDSNSTAAKEESGFLPGSIGGWLYNVLSEKGPQRFIDIRNVVENLPANTSVNSIGPILLTNGIFIRFAPGIYGLAKHASLFNSAVLFPACMLSAEQCRIYVMARHAKEPISFFAGWNATYEYALSKWAENNTEKDLFRSLLTVIDPSRWECDDTEKFKWIECQQAEGAYQIYCDNKRHDNNIPALNGVLNALIYLKLCGSLSWMSINRCSHDRVDDHHAISTLILLIGMRVLIPAQHWQDEHKSGPELDRILKKIMLGRESGHNLDWSNPVFNELICSIECFECNGWIMWEDFAVVRESILTGNGLKSVVEANPQQSDSIDNVISNTIWNRNDDDSIEGLLSSSKWENAW